MNKILIVDDDSQIREIVKFFLEKQGYMIFEASNGFKAIKLCKLNEFDLVIADIYMPGMDGIKFIEELQKFSPKTKVIAISGGEQCHFFSSGLQLASALHRGAIYSLKKPIKMEELQDIIKEIIVTAS
ncbi:MAG: response regulator [Candidatus Kuenenia sp.]|nr:response regulator [Candidatus Kuenenia hertensis]